MLTILFSIVYFVGALLLVVVTAFEFERDDGWRHSLDDEEHLRVLAEFPVRRPEA